MNKRDFLASLRAELCGLPEAERAERLDFYAEMIDDRVEEGASEEEAVAGLGPVSAVAEQIIAEVPLVKLAKKRLKPQRRLRTWELLLLSLGSPVWLSLLVSALAVVLSVYVSLWSVIVSLWAGFASLAACAFGGGAVGCVMAVNGNLPAGVVMVSAGLVSAGLAILFFFGCKAATRALVLLTRKAVLTIKKRFVRKGEA